MATIWHREATIAHPRSTISVLGEETREKRRKGKRGKKEKEKEERYKRARGAKWPATRFSGL
jgi:hypothetical protein